jgi:hypothetical protein
MALTQERLKELLKYDPETGVFEWQVKRKKVPTKPYSQVWIDGRYYLLHRLAWLYVHGEIPSLFIDHINCDPTDHRIANLRLATNAQNQANQRAHRDNKVGLKGVRRVGKRYRAVIRHNDKPLHLGYFATPEEAHAAYCSAASRFFGEFARAA